jgi:hypothetical protein
MRTTNGDHGTPLLEAGSPDPAGTTFGRQPADG